MGCDGAIRTPAIADLFRRLRAELADSALRRGARIPDHRISRGRRHVRPACARTDPGAKEYGAQQRRPRGDDRVWSCCSSSGNGEGHLTKETTKLEHQMLMRHLHQNAHLLQKIPCKHSTCLINIQTLDSKFDILTNDRASGPR